jgi:hypothetical protein
VMRLTKPADPRYKPSIVEGLRLASVVMEGTELRCNETFEDWERWQQRRTVHFLLCEDPWVCAVVFDKRKTSRKGYRLGHVSADPKLVSVAEAISIVTPALKQFQPLYANSYPPCWQQSVIEGVLRGN